MEDEQGGNRASISTQQGDMTKDKGLRTGLLILGKFVGGLVFAVGILLLIPSFLCASQREPIECLPTFLIALTLITSGICLWVRAGQTAFGFWRGICTLVGALFFTSGILDLLVLLAAHITGIEIPHAGLLLRAVFFRLVLGIPMLIFGFMPKKGIRRKR